MNSFKSYVNNVNVAAYKNNSTQSSLSGFIPVELGLTLEGLSGMKIYNKISINQKFLPPAYPKALKFVIRGINHGVKDNKWRILVGEDAKALDKWVRESPEEAYNMTFDGQNRSEVDDTSTNL